MGRSDFFHEFGHFPPSKMGRVRTKTVKKAPKVIIEKYYTKLTLDFDTNKKIIEEIALIPSKPLRNKIAGFVTHLMKRLEKPIEIDQETKDLLKMLDMTNLSQGAAAPSKF